MMYFEPEKFIELADKLATDEDYFLDARIRTAVSRAYYFVFLISKQKVENYYGTDFSVKSKKCKMTTHQIVIEKLKSIDGGLGNMLSDLRDLRVNADYELDVNLDLQTALKMNKDCRSFVRNLDETLQG